MLFRSSLLVSAKIIEDPYLQDYYTFSFIFLAIPVIVLIVLTILGIRLVSLIVRDSKKKCVDDEKQIETREVRIETQQNDDLNKRSDTDADDVTESSSGECQALTFTTQCMYIYHFSRNKSSGGGSGEG